MLRQPIVVVVGHVDHGKCVDGNTRIWLADGRLKTARELYEEYSSQGAEITVEDGVAIETRNGPMLLSFDGERMIPQQATHVWKRRAAELIEVNLSNGDVVKTTPEHPFLVFNDFAIEYKRADQLKAGNVVMGPAALNLEENKDWKGEILERMALAGDFVAFIDEVAAVKFLRDIDKATKKWLKNEGLLSTSFSRNRFRISDLVLISKRLGYPLSEVYDWIVAVKASSEKWRAGHTAIPVRLPRQESLHQLGYFLGAWIGDGSAKAILSNNDVDVQSAYQTAIKEVFGVSATVRWGGTCWSVVPKAAQTIVRLLYDVFELPSGKKSGKVTLPWICQNNTDCFRGFIEGWFDTDGYVSPLNYSIDFTTKSEELARQAAVRLIATGVQAIVHEKNGYFNVRIANREFLAAFLNSFSPKLSRRADRIKEALKKASTSRNIDVFPITGEVMKKLAKALPGKVNRKIPYFSRYQNGSSLSHYVLSQVSQNIAKSNESSVNLQQFLLMNLRGFRVTSTQKYKNEDEWVYDFTVPETSNFLAERIIIHNTSILDAVRQTTVTAREAGGITQAVGASEVPIDVIEKVCGELKKKLKVKFTIPGLLFIDTPGHEVFANLRKRGGSIADIAVLVIDINQGIQPQTIESLQLLRQYKTPFIVAATKIDAISGWRKQINACFSDSLAGQRSDVQQRLDEKLYELVGQLSQHNFSSERFDRVGDLTKQIIIVPVSAHTREGLQELLLYVAGLAQRYLEKRLELHSSMPGKGSILEVKEEKGLGKTIDVILYDGVLHEGDEVAFGTTDGKAMSSKVKAILRPKPLDEMRDLREKFSKVKLASAATGVKIACEGAEQALPGSSLFVVTNKVNRSQIFEQLEREYSEVVVETEKEGVTIRADALGSLEAILSIFSAAKVPINSAKIGAVAKRDVAEAKAIASKDKFKGVIFAFNVPVQLDVERECSDNNVKLFKENIIYNLLEGYARWVEEEKAAEKKKAFTELAYPSKIQLLPGHCFRVNNPMICGVEILEGKLKKGTKLINDAGEEIGEVRAIQSEKKEVDSASKGQQVAVSVAGPTYGRQVKEKQVLYVDLPKEDLALLTTKYASSLTEEEKDLVKQVKKIKGMVVF